MFLGLCHAFLPNEADYVTTTRTPAWEPRAGYADRWKSNQMFQGTALFSSSYDSSHLSPFLKGLTFYASSISYSAWLDSFTFFIFFFFTFYIRFSYIIQRKLNPFFAGEHVLLQYKKKRKLPSFFAGQHVFVLHFEKKTKFHSFFALMHVFI